MASYYGGKSGSGSYQAIINQIPPHHIYVEMFGGNVGVFRNKRKAVKTLILEKDPDQIPFYKEIGLKDIHEMRSVPGDPNYIRKVIYHDEHYHGDYYLICDSLSLHNSITGGIFGQEYLDRPGVFIYADPPYPLTSRKDPRERYKFELSDDDHRDLLMMLCNLRHAKVAISSYENEIYWDYLMERAYEWRFIEFSAQTRKGPATNLLWMNFPEPESLHDYRYLGEDYRQRENITRQQRRWLRKLKKMPVLEQRAMVSVLQESI